VKTGNLARLAASMTLNVLGVDQVSGKVYEQL
jgi:hypothetical protein